MPSPEVGNSHQIRVLVAEHKGMLREGICQLLRSAGDFDVVGIAGDGVEALSMTRESRPDVLLLELELPKMTGLRVLELLRPDSDGARTLLFGTSVSPDTAVHALALGARGVLQHDQSSTLLFRSIRALANGDYWVDRSLVGKLAQQVHRSATPFQLTPRQRQVVSLVVAGYSNKEIAERFKLSSDTVKHHLTSLFDKTGASTRVELAVFALHHGIAGAEIPPPEAICPAAVPVRMARVPKTRPEAEIRKQPA